MMSVLVMLLAGAIGDKHGEGTSSSPVVSNEGWRCSFNRAVLLPWFFMHTIGCLCRTFIN